MRQQSLKTSWRNLADACERMIRWRSFALWVRAIIRAERSVPPWLSEAIDQRCPGFLEGRSGADNLESLWLDLSAWIDERVFAIARAGGWIEALHYYSGRDPRSEQIWQCWEHTEASWREQKPPCYPTADEWHQDALKQDATRAEAAELVTQYIEWEAFAFWARLIVGREVTLPEDLGAIIEQRCPGFLAHIRNEKQTRMGYSTWLWRQLLAWIETHILADATGASLPEAVRDAARRHLRSQRVTAYWAECDFRWQKQLPHRYPQFEEWLQHADEFRVQEDHRIPVR